jgi:L-rhamnose-H+ transport protein
LEANPFLGVIFHWIGGLASASCYLPFRGIKRWSWEVYWLVQGVFSWILAPLFFATLLVPHLWQILHAAPASSIGYAYFWGLLWGLGGLTFGLSVRYLGIALGYPIALGLCTAFGTLMPPIFSGQIHTILHETSGQFILLGIGVCMLGIVFSGLAGVSKEKELTTEQKQETVEEFQYFKGLLVAIFAGVMSACFAYGLAAGRPIGDIAAATLRQSHQSELWQNLPVLVVVLWGGFTTNFLWCMVLLLRNHSYHQYLGAAAPTMDSFEVIVASETLSQTGLSRNPFPRSSPFSKVPLLLNYTMAAIAGVTWYFQFFFYSMGQTKMGKYDFSSWTLHMASIIIFSTIWGILLKEWRGTSPRTRWLVAAGLALLVVSTLVVGYGNYLKANGPATQATTQAMLAPLAHLRHIVTE